MYGIAFPLEVSSARIAILTIAPSLSLEWNPL